MLLKKTSSAMEAGDNEDDDPVALGARGWTLGDPQGCGHGLHSDAERSCEGCSLASLRAAQHLCSDFNLSSCVRF